MDSTCLLLRCALDRFLQFQILLQNRDTRPAQQFYKPSFNIKARLHITNYPDNNIIITERKYRGKFIYNNNYALFDNNYKYILDDYNKYTKQKGTVVWWQFNYFKNYKDSIKRNQWFKIERIKKLI